MNVYIVWLDTYKYALPILIRWVLIELCYKVQSITANNSPVPSNFDIKIYMRLFQHCMEYCIYNLYDLYYTI